MKSSPINQLAKEGLIKGLPKLKYAKDHLCSAYQMGIELQQLTSRHVSSGLVPNSDPSTSINPPTKKDLDILFQPMFDYYFKPSPSVISLTSSAITLPQDTTEGNFSISIDHDPPSPRNTPNTKTTTNPIQDANVEEPNQ
ncbi:hypothetical protein Tco_0378904 [Tanacetum coccineum]